MATAEPSPPSSPQSDESLYLNYAARLKKIPGFEAYQYDSENSSYGDEHADVLERVVRDVSSSRLGVTNGRRAFVPHKSDTDRLPIPQTSHVPRNSTLQRGSIAAHARTSVVAMLKMITHRRELLMQLESQIKVIHRKLASFRKEQTDELKHGTKMEEGGSLGLVSLRRQFKRLQEKVSSIADEMTILEEELERLEAARARQHWDIKAAEETLYAALTSGCRPGDSDASEEDRLLAAWVNESDAKTDSEMAGRYQPYILQVQDNHVLQKTTTSRLVNDSTGELASCPKSSSSLESLQLSPFNQYGNQVNGIDNVAGVETQGNLNTRAFRGRTNEMFGIGHHFLSDDSENLTKYIDAAARDRLLAPTNALVRIRKIDFSSSLGYDIDHLGPQIVLAGIFRQGESVNVLQKLARIHVESIHTAQLISIWGRQMSQNSILEASRTYTYGNLSRTFVDFVGMTVPRGRLIEDVRKLTVPLQSADVFNQPLIAIPKQTEKQEGCSSVRVNRSVAVSSTSMFEN